MLFKATTAVADSKHVHKIAKHAVTKKRLFYRSYSRKSEEEQQQQQEKKRTVIINEHKERKTKKR